LLNTEKFKDKSAENVLSGIKVAKDFLFNINESNLHILMYASGSFGFGFGSKKIKLILESFPKIIQEYDDNDRNEWIKKLKSIKGISELSESFIDNINKYKIFIKTIKDYIQYTNLSKQPLESKINKKMEKSEVVVFSGFRDKILKQTLEKNGHIVNDNVTKETTVVVYDEDDDSSKCQKAKKMCIKLIQKEDVFNILNIN